MLQIIIPKTEQWDDKAQEFVYGEETTLSLEHSLVSLSKWESKWHKPFLSKDKKTEEELLDYIRCMTITQNVSDSVYKRLTHNNLKEINAYIDDSMTATTFWNWFDNEEKASSNKEQITSELVYYWMIALQIPFECQKWHLNRLLTLIKVCNVKSQSPKKHSMSSLMHRNASMNALRRKHLGTHG